MEKLVRSKAMIAMVGGVIMAEFGKYAPIVSCVLFVIVLDTVTGLVKCKVRGTPITSKRGSKGFWKKVGLICALFLGFFFDFFFPYLLSVVDFELPFKSPVGTIFGCYIVLNESISVCENLAAINPGIVPAWVLRLLTGAHNKIEGKEETK